MRTRVTICYFGITRSLRHTLSSIEAQVIAPSRALTGQAPMQCAHLFRQAWIDNPRTGEAMALDPTEHECLTLDRLEREDPDACLRTWDFDGLKLYGDAWNTAFTSLRNLVQQLHSLDRVTDLALREDARVVVYARPDLSYHDSLERPLRAALKARRPGVWLPAWQSWSGRNDRFAICAGRSAIEAYGRRVRMAHAYCEAHGPLHAERLLAHVLAEAGLPVHTFGARASRVRAGGAMVAEDFRLPGTGRLRRGRSGLARISGWHALRRRLRGWRRSGSVPR